MMIVPFQTTIDGWTIDITDTGTKFKDNNTWLNHEQTSNQCNYGDCTETFMKTRMSGLCNTHKKHEHDLLLKLTSPDGTILEPLHQHIIDALISATSNTNINLTNFFSKLSGAIIGNVQDVSTLAGKTVHTNTQTQTLTQIFTTIEPTIEEIFPDHNIENHTLQEIEGIGNISLLALAKTMVGLLICEESNRGDRWFCENIINAPQRTTQLGAAMAIASFATKSFAWEVDFNKATSRKF